MTSQQSTSPIDFKPEPARDYFGTNTNSNSNSNPSSPIKPTISNSSVSKRVSRSNSSGILAKIASRVSSHVPKDSISSSINSTRSEDLAINTSPSGLKGSLSKSSKKNRSSATAGPEDGGSPTSPKADMSALTRSNSKYKSAVKWDAADFTQVDEPFMQSTLPADDLESKRLEQEETQKREQDEQMLAQGSTAAAKAFAQRNSIGVGDPIFAGNYRLRLQEEEAKNRLKQEQFVRDQRNSIGMGSHISSNGPRPTGNKPGMVMPNSTISTSSSTNNFNGSRGASPPSTSGILGNSSEAFPSSNPQNGVLAEAAQRVLEAARRSAKGDVSQPSGSLSAREPSASVNSHNTSISNHKTSTEASSSLRPSAASPSPPMERSESRSHSLSPSPAPSIKGKRKSFLGGFRKSSTNLEEDLKNSNAGKKGKGKNSDGESVKSGGGKNEKKGSRSRTPSESASKSPGASLTTTQENEDGSGGGGGTTTPGGTISRRYRDTREMHLVASELAAQALVGNEYPYASFAAAAGQQQFQSNGTQSPSYNSGTRTPSEGLTVGNNRRGASAYSWGGPEMAPHAVGMNMPNGSASQTNLISSPSHSGFLTPMTNNPNGGSAPTSPRFGTSELSPGGSPNLGGNPGQRSRQGSTGYAIHATQTQQAKLNGLPHDMLTGLGDGPYPALARRLEAAGLDMLDPFGIPTTHDRDSPFAASVRANNNGSHSPGTSVSSHHQQQSSSGTSTPSGRRPMLQMSMSAPAAELDYGLTKLGKGRQSRSASRNVTPQQSKEKLRDRAKKDAEKDGTGLVNGGNVNGSRKGSATNVANGNGNSNLNNPHHPPSSAGAAVNAGSSSALGLSKSISPPNQSSNSIRPPSSPVPSSSSSSSRGQKNNVTASLGSPAPISISRSPRSVSPNPTPSNISKNSSQSSGLIATAASSLNPSSSTNLKPISSRGNESNSENSSEEKEKKKSEGLKPSNGNSNNLNSDSNGMLSTSVSSSKGLGRFSFFGKKKDQEKEKDLSSSSSTTTATIPSSPKKPSDEKSKKEHDNQSKATVSKVSQPQTSMTNASPSQAAPISNVAQTQAEPIAMKTRPSDSSVASLSTRESDDSFRLPYLANSPEKGKTLALAATVPMSSLGSQRQMPSPTTATPTPQPPITNLVSNPREISRSRSREAMPAPQMIPTARQGGDPNLGLSVNGNGSENPDPRGRKISNVSSSSQQLPNSNGVSSPSSPPRPERSNERIRNERSPNRRPNGMVMQVGPNGTPLQSSPSQQQLQERNRVASNPGGSSKGSLPFGIGNHSSTSLSSNTKGSMTPRIPGSPSSNSISGIGSGQKHGQQSDNSSNNGNGNNSSKLNPKNNQESKEKEKEKVGRFSKFVKSLTNSNNDKDGRGERSGTPSSITSSKSNKSQQIKSQPNQSPQSTKAQTMRGIGQKQNSLPISSKENGIGSQSLSSRPRDFGTIRSNSGPGPSPSSPAPSNSTMNQNNSNTNPSNSRNVVSRANPFQLASSKTNSKVDETSAPPETDSGKSTPSFATAGSGQNSPEIARKNLLSREELERQARLTDALGLNSTLISGASKNVNGMESKTPTNGNFINQEMSNSGFGTKSAIYSSSQNQNINKSNLSHNNLGIKSNSNTNSYLSSSSSFNPNLNNSSTGDLSPQISERSASGGSGFGGSQRGNDDGSTSTRSTDSNGGLRTPGVNNFPLTNENSLIGGMEKVNGNPNVERVGLPGMI